MITILVDHNIKGYAVVLWGILASEGWDWRMTAVTGKLGVLPSKTG